MKNRVLCTILAAFMLPLVSASAQTNVTQAGISLFTGANATAGFTSNAIRLPTFSGQGVLSVTGNNIAGSPSGCTINFAYQGNNTATTSAVVAYSVAITPANGVQTFAVTPTPSLGDNYVATYACSSTYPTAGTITASLSTINPVSQDLCFNGAKTSVSVAISTATTTQLVALTAGKIVHVCGFNATFGASTTAQLEYGTGSACGTGTTALTGVYAPATGTYVSMGTGEATVTKTVAGNALCLVSTGTGGINGVLTYVQQ